jgi:hypothetical protein
MSRTVAALALDTTIAAALPACSVGPLICTSGDPCSQPEDHSGEVVAISALVALTAIVLVTAGHHDDARPAVAAPTGGEAAMVEAATDDNGVSSLDRLVVQGEAQAAVGRCDKVLSLARFVEARYPTFYADRFAPDRPIAACLTAASRPQFGMR